MILLLQYVFGRVAIYGTDTECVLFNMYNTCRVYIFIETELLHYTNQKHI